MARDPGNKRGRATRINVADRNFRFRDSIGGPGDPNDWFRFDLTSQRSTFSARLTRLRENAILKLVGPGVRVVSRRRGRGRRLQLNTNAELGPGTYFLQIRSRGGQTPYRLIASATTLPPTTPPDNGGDNGGGTTPPPETGGNSLATAQAFSTSELSSKLINGRLGDTYGSTVDREDWYSFTANTTDIGSNLQLTLSNLTSNADFDLIGPQGGSPLFPLASKGEFTDSTTENINVTIAEAGAYYIKVYNTSGQTNYRLNIALNAPDRVGDALAVPSPDEDLSIEDAIDISGATTNATRPEKVGSNKGGGVFDQDVYNFVVPSGQRRFVSLDLDNTGTSGNIDLELFRSDDLINPIITSTRAGLDNEQLAGTLGEGTYFIRVSSAATDGAAIGYSLSLFAKNTIDIPTLVRDINFGSGDSNADNLSNINGIVYFAAQNSTGNWGLWKSDGTLSETRLVREFGTATADKPSSIIDVANDGIYFLSGASLWRTDGQTGNTAPVTLTGVSGTISNLIVVGSSIYFTAGSGFDLGLFRLKSGTVTTIVTPASGTRIENLTVVGSGASAALYYSRFRTTPADPDVFTGGIELHRILNADETSVTESIIDVNKIDPRDINGADTNSNPRGFAVAGNTLYFIADGDNGLSGDANPLPPQVWRISNSDSDATEIIIGDLNDPGLDILNPSGLVYVGGTTDSIFLTADSTLNGAVQAELARISNASGTPTSASFIDLSGTSISSTPNKLTAAGDKLFFAAADSSDSDIDLFVWENTAPTTATKVTNIANDPFFDNLTAVGDDLFFTASSGGSQVLWFSDGTLGGTSSRPNYDDVSNPGGFQAVGDRLFFTGEDADSASNRGFELWAVDRPS